MKKHYYCFTLLALGFFQAQAFTTPNIATTAIAPPDCELITPVSATATTGNAALAIDGNGATRWESEFTDAQSFTVDLGALTQINSVSIDWETANAKDYILRGSVDGTTWIDIVTQSNMAIGVRTDLIAVNAQYQWLKVEGVSRNTPYGYSIYEFYICSTGIVAPPECNAVAIISATASTGNAALAVDGVDGSRWESEVADPQSLTVDLGAVTLVHGVNIDWETANAKDYYLRGSVDGTTWTDIVYKTDMPTGPRTDAITDIDAEYRWLKMDGVTRNTPYGYSIYEFEVCGEPGEVEVPYTAIPAQIEAEDYSAMSGVQTEASADEGGGEVVNYIDAGDWMDYNIDVPANGTYTMALRIASPLDTGVIQVLVDGEPLTIDTITVPNTTGWQVWQTINTSFAMTAGQHTIRLLAVMAGYNLNWINFTTQAAGTEGFSKAIALYPNPAHGIVNITAVNSGSLTIYNQYGALVHTQQMAAGENNINISQLATGVYMVMAGGVNSRLIIK